MEKEELFLISENYDYKGKWTPRDKGKQGEGDLKHGDNETSKGWEDPQVKEIEGNSESMDWNVPSLHKA